MDIVSPSGLTSPAWLTRCWVWSIFLASLASMPVLARQTVSASELHDQACAADDLFGQSSRIHRGTGGWRQGGSRRHDGLPRRLLLSAVRVSLIENSKLRHYIRLEVSNRDHVNSNQGDTWERSGVWLSRRCSMLTSPVRLSGFSAQLSLIMVMKLLMYEGLL